MARRARSFVGPGLLVACAALGLVACGDDTDDPGGDGSVPGTEVIEPAPANQVLVSAIRHVAGLRPADDDSVPVVFIVSVGENGISAGLQADVAAALRDKIDVRFSDERDEAIDQSADGAPVRDGGVLMLVGDLPEQADPVAIAVQVYYDEDDRTRAIFTLEPEPAGGTAPPDSTVWRVTATSLVALDAPT